MNRHIGWRLALVASLAVFAACEAKDEEEQLTPDAGPVETDAGVGTADALLRASDTVGACAAYRQDLVAQPADPKAAFGAALSCALTLPDSPAVTELLDSCGQPHLEVHKNVFGPTGFLAKERERRAGSSTVTVRTQAVASGGFAPAAFSPDRFLTSVDTYEGKRLQIDLEDVGEDSPESRNFLWLSVPYEFTSGYAGPQPSLVDGLELTYEQLRDRQASIGFEVRKPDGESIYYGMPFEGSVLFRKVGTGAAGDAIEIEFKGLKLESSGYCPSWPCDFPAAELNGAIQDTADAEFAWPKLPFEDVAPDEGVPYREAFVVALDGCPGLSTEYINGQVKKLLGELAKTAALLDVVLAAPEANSFQFVVPGSLFHLDGEIPVNVTDVRLVRALVGGLLALGEDVTQYKVLAKSFAELMDTYERHLAEGGTRQERGFLIEALVTDLNANFLAKREGYDFGPAKAWLREALEDARAAATEAPQKPGIFNFQVEASRPFASEVDSLLSFLNTSLETTGLLGFPNAADYRISLKTWFDEPIDREAFATNLFSLETSELSNEDLAINEVCVEDLFAKYVMLPADQSSLSCDADAEVSGCPANYRCEPNSWDTAAGTCQKPSFLPIDQAALEQALGDSDEPTFFNVKALKPFWIL